MRMTTIKPPLDEKFRLRWRAVGANAIFNRNDAVFVFAERRVNQSVFFAHMAVDDGEIFFFDGAAFEDFSEFAGGPGIFCNQNDAAGLTVEAVDQMWRSSECEFAPVFFQIQRMSRLTPAVTIIEMQPRAPDQAGHLAVLGRMTDESGGLVDDQQVVVFKNDFKKFFQARKRLPQGRGAAKKIVLFPPACPSAGFGLCCAA